MNKTPALSVIIVNWNGKDALRNCLQSLYKYENADGLEIIVSDNHSSDGSVDMLEREFPAVTVLENPYNLGFAGGNNTALPHAAGEFVLMLNPDMEFIGTGLEKLVAHMRENPDIGICGCTVRNADGSFMRQCRRGYPDPLTAFFKASGIAALFPGNVRMAKYFYGNRPENEPMDVDAVSGSFMLARKEALKKVGGLGDEYFMYVEDVDLCAKARKAGYRIAYLPLMEIRHHGGACVEKRPRNRIFYHYHMTRSHVVLYAKDRMENGGGIGWHIAFGLVVLRYTLLSLLLANTGMLRHIAEFLDIHNGAIGRARYET